MLKEMNTIAAGLLGLHGYPLVPLSWAGMFGGRAAPKRSEPTDNPAPDRREVVAFDVSSRGHVYW